MKLLAKQTDESTLTDFGNEAVSMLMQRDYVSLASRFGYALAYGRELAAAIKEDYERAVGASSEARADAVSSIKVKYFALNSSGVFAVVECFVPVARKSAVLLELVVSGSDAEKYITIEDISSVAA